MYNSADRKWVDKNNYTSLNNTGSLNQPSIMNPTL